MAQFEFDADGEPTYQGYEPIPAAWYRVVIIESEMKESQKGGEYLQLVMEVTGDNEYQGRKVFERLNLVNENDTAVKIARAKLASICKAVGIPRISDSEELHDIEFMVKVAQRKRQDNGEMANEIKDFKSTADYRASLPDKSAPKPTEKATGKPKGDGTPPWKRN